MIADMLAAIGNIARYRREDVVAPVVQIGFFDTAFGFFDGRMVVDVGFEQLCLNTRFLRFANCRFQSFPRLRIVSKQPRITVIKIKLVKSKRRQIRLYPC